MKKFMTILILLCQVAIATPKEGIEWSRPHDPSIAGYSKKDEIGNKWTLEQFETELERSKKYIHNVWYYLGSTESEHVFLGIDYSSPMSMYDEESGDLFCDIGPFVMLASVPTKEFKISKQMKLTKNSKRWIMVEELKDISHIKSVLTTPGAARPAS